MLSDKFITGPPDLASAYLPQAHICTAYVHNLPLLSLQSV